MRLTRAEFERRAEARPDLKVVELVEGVVHVAPPPRVAAHARPHLAVIVWLGIYEDATPGVLAIATGTARLDGDNVVQPDAALLVDPGGQACIGPDDYVEGAPELVVEIAAGADSIDLREKLAVYHRNGVREYLVWRPPEGRFDWFEWTRGAYRARTPDAAGIIRSAVFPGLWLDVAALLRADRARVRRTLRAGLSRPDHAAFKTRLRGLKPTRQAARSGQTRRRRSAVEYVQSMSLPTDRAAAVGRAAEEFERRAFLPRFGDIRMFCETYGIEEPKSKSRASGIPRIFKFLAAMDAADVEEILDSRMYSGPSTLGPIAEAIRQWGEARREPAARR